MMLPSIVVASGALVARRRCSWRAGDLAVGGALGSWRVARDGAAGVGARAVGRRLRGAHGARASCGSPTCRQELGRADVQHAWSVRAARAELRCSRSIRRASSIGSGDELPSVFDWEEAPTPVAGSFALHRHVGHFDLLVVADDSDERGLAFAARMQPLLDECLMEAQ